MQRQRVQVQQRGVDQVGGGDDPEGDHDTDGVERRLLQEREVAWESSAAPDPVNKPGYRVELDSDKNGVACGRS